MLIDFCTSEPHFADHLLGVWHALPPEHRGTWFVPRVDVLEHVARLIAPARPVPQVPETGSGIVVVASATDMGCATITGHRVVYLEHGAGQSYVGRLQQGGISYAGHPNREGVVAILVPGPHPAARNREVHPGIRVEEIGCPHVDRLTAQLEGWRRRPGPPRVAISFHWPCRVCPETWWARDEYAQAVGALVRSGEWEILGHGHPRAAVDMRKWWKRMGVRYLEHFSEVLEEADLYCVDNSSTLFEFAAVTDRPVVALNASFFRRDVHHGLRFWDAIPGLQATPADLHQVIRRALGDPEEAQEAREHALRKVYTHRDGRAAERVVQILEEVAHVEPDLNAEEYPAGAAIVRVLTILDGPETGGRTTIRPPEKFCPGYEVHRIEGRLKHGRRLTWINPLARVEELVQLGRVVVVRPAGQVMDPPPPANPIGVTVHREGAERETKMLAPGVVQGVSGSEALPPAGTDAPDQALEAGGLTGALAPPPVAPPSPPSVEPERDEVPAGGPVDAVIKCTVCDRTFSSIGGLRLHTAKKHPPK